MDGVKNGVKKRVKKRPNLKVKSFKQTKYPSYKSILSTSLPHHPPPAIDDARVGGGQVLPVIPKSFVPI